MVNTKAVMRFTLLSFVHSGTKAEAPFRPSPAPFDFPDVFPSFAVFLSFAI